MPRKSAAALSVVALRVPRLRPPDDLTEAQAAIWRTVVESLPAEHFRRVDSHLLRSFVEVTARLREAEQSLRLGVVHGDAINPSLGVYERAVRLQMALARSLRIATSSRVDKVSAGANARRDSSAQPWRYDDLEGKTDPPEWGSDLSRFLDAAGDLLREVFEQFERENPEQAAELSAGGRRHSDRKSASICPAFRSAQTGADAGRQILENGASSPCNRPDSNVI